MISGSMRVLRVNRLIVVDHHLNRDLHGRKPRKTRVAYRLPFETEISDLATRFERVQRADLREPRQLSPVQ